MPPTLHRFHESAVDEAVAAQRWYAERNPAAGRAFTVELLLAVDRVLEAPERWPKMTPKVRRYVFPRFPFSLVYRVRDNAVEILAVAHHKRKPGYWKSRT